MPGFSLIGAQVCFPPNGWTPPHRHGGATVVALVTKGQVLSGMNGNPPKIYGEGESFIEMPGCHHTVGDNASQTEEASMVVQFVVESKVVSDGGYQTLLVLDDTTA
jgi:quercetin dioxygenase-like cupin family protein